MSRRWTSSSWRCARPDAAGAAAALTIVDRQPGANRASGTAVDPANGTTGIAELRDGEIERLLAENGRLNERVKFLLKVMEHDQTRNATLTADHAAIDTDRDVIFRDMTAAVEAELPPSWRSCCVCSKSSAAGMRRSASAPST